VAERSGGGMKKLLIILCIAGCIAGCSKSKKGEVVIYTSLDQIFSEPILKSYEEKTGITVKAVYDVEAAKTTGMVNRLIAEKGNPQCDVFWNSEIGRTLVLKEKGVLAPYLSRSAVDIPSQFKDKDGYWAGFAARARVLLYNTKLVKEGEAPRSIFDLIDPRWRGKVALPNPLFGTTATHCAALFEVLGNIKAEKYFEQLKYNRVAIVSGNSISRDQVRDGELMIGFTDTDDANIAIVEGKPVKMVYPDKDGIGTLLIPNTVAFIAGAPHREEGKKLIDYLLSREVEEKLAFCPSAQMPVRKGVKTPKGLPGFDEIKAMDVDYEKIAKRMEETGKYLEKLFVK
jgi:iron(III) transport system substrate-binding protein